MSNIKYLKKSFDLTQAGHTLLTHAQHVLNQVEHMRQDLSDLAGGKIGHLRVGMIEPVARLYLVEVLRAFSRWLSPYVPYH